MVTSLLLLKMKRKTMFFSWGADYSWRWKFYDFCLPWTKFYTHFERFLPSLIILVLSAHSLIDPSWYAQVGLKILSTDVLKNLWLKYT